MLTCTITSTKDTEDFKNLASVTVPAFSGEMQILPGHAEMFVKLKAGEVILHFDDNKLESKEIEMSECHVKDNKILIII